MIRKSVSQSQAAGTLQVLIDKYLTFASGRPLKVGMVTDRQAACPDVHAKLLVAPVRLHTNTLSYQKTLIEGGPRYDLDGNISGKVQPAQAAHAIETLAQFECSLQDAAAREEEGNERAAKPPGEKTAPLPERPMLSTAKTSQTPEPGLLVQSPLIGSEQPNAPRRLSLADLREAARRRRTIEETR